MKKATGAELTLKRYLSEYRIDMRMGWLEAAWITRRAVRRALSAVREERRTA